MTDDLASRIRQRLHRRSDAYRTLFLNRGASKPWWQFWKGNPASLTPTADIVLRDLAAYCYAGKPTLKVSLVTQQTDPYAMAFAEGRRDVFNRIVSLCNLTPEQINRIATARSNHDDP